MNSQSSFLVKIRGEYTTLDIEEHGFGAYLLAPPSHTEDNHSSTARARLHLHVVERSFAPDKGRAVSNHWLHATAVGEQASLRYGGRRGCAKAQDLSLFGGSFPEYNPIPPPLQALGFSTAALRPLTMPENAIPPRPWLTEKRALGRLRISLHPGRRLAGMRTWRVTATFTRESGPSAKRTTVETDTINYWISQEDDLLRHVKLHERTEYSSAALTGSAQSLTTDEVYSKTFSRYGSALHVALPRTCRMRTF